MTMQELRTNAGGSYSEKVTIYIPATKNTKTENGGKITENINNKKYVESAAMLLSGLFGGATAQNSCIGYWYDDEQKKLIAEGTTPVYSFCESVENGLEQIYNYCIELKAELLQDAIGLEINGEMFFI